MSSVRIVAVSDSAQILGRIRDAVAANPVFELIPAGERVADAAVSASDIVIYDLEREGWEVMLAANISQPQAPLVVALADELSADGIWNLFRDGVAAVLPRTAAAQELEAALDAVTRGVLVLSRDLLGDVAPQANSARPPIMRSVPPTPTPAAPTLLEELTAREQAVVAMLAGGLSNKEMAKQLGISLHTVKYHLASVFGKLGATSRTEAVMIALRSGLVMV